MTDRDREIVDEGKAWIDKYYSNKTPGLTIKALIEIIDRLDKQLTEIKEAGEPFKEVNPSVNECKWVLDDDGFYQTHCGGAWELTSGNLSDNEVKFCPYCGGRIKEVKDE